MEGIAYTDDIDPGRAKEEGSRPVMKMSSHIWWRGFSPVFLLFGEPIPRMWTESGFVQPTILHIRKGVCLVVEASNR